MLQDKEIINLLKGALKSYIKCLEKKWFCLPRIQRTNNSLYKCIK